MSLSLSSLYVIGSEVHLPRLQRVLFPDASQRRIQLWHASFVASGPERTAAVEQELQKASLFLVLVDKKLLASSRCRHELLVAQRRVNEAPAERRLIPVHVEAAPSAEGLLAGHQGLPGDGRTIATQMDGEGAWRLVADRVLDAVQSHSRPAERAEADRSLNVTLSGSADPVGLQPIQNRFALLVGVNVYEDTQIPELMYCANDVEVLEQVLRGAGYTVVALHEATDPSRRPTRNRIEAELERICKVAGPNDLILLHFGCHGQLFSDKPVLLVADSYLDTLDRTGLPVSVIEAALRASRSSRRIVFLDACYVGVGRSLAPEQAEFTHQAHELAAGMVLVAASTSMQVAQDWNDKRMGAFSYFLAQALRGEADSARRRYVTIDDITDYTLANLRRWSIEHHRRLQEPTVRKEGMGSMIVVDYRGRPPAEPPRPVQEPPLPRNQNDVLLSITSRSRASELPRGLTAELAELFDDSAKIRSVLTEAASLLREADPGARPLTAAQVPFDAGARIAWEAVVMGAANVGARALGAILLVAAERTDARLGKVEQALQYLIRMK